MEHYKAPQGQHRESLGLLCCAGVGCRDIRYVSRDREDVRIPIVGASSFLERLGLLLCHVLCWLLL